MAAKLSVLFMFFLTTVYIAQAAEIPQDHKTAKETLDETFNKIRAGIEEIAAKVQTNEFVVKSGQVLKDLGHTIEERGKHVLEKLKSETKSR